MAESIVVESLPESLGETISLIISHENIKEEPVETDTVDQEGRCNEYFVIEKYEEPQEAVIHPSISGSKEDFLDRQQLSEHCFLCPGHEQILSSNSHFIENHLQQSIHICGKLLALCRLECKKTPHYHCPHQGCLFSCPQKHTLKIHYFSHSAQPMTNRTTGYVPSVEKDINNCQKIGKSELTNEEVLKFKDVLTDAVLQRENSYNFSSKDKADICKDDFFRKAALKPSLAFHWKHLVKKLRMPKCYLCQDTRYPTKARLLRHFTRLHLGHHVQLGDYFIALCKLPCSEMRSSHYHCPYSHCLDTFKVKSRLSTHFASHFHDASNKKYQQNIGEIPRLLPHSYENITIGFPPPKKTFNFHGMNYFSHDCIAATALDLYRKLCLPFCYLCHDRKPYFTMSRLERHFNMAHMSRAVDCGSCYTVQCGLHCIPNNTYRRHYHCPFCQLKDPRRCAFWVHLESHRRSFTGVNKESRVYEDCAPRKSLVSDEPVHVDSPSVTISVSEGNDPTSSVVNVLNSTINCNEYYQGIAVSYRPSVSTNTDAILAAAHLPHCHLCNDNKDYISEKRLLTHIRRCHIKPSFQMDHIYILLCKKYCSEKHQDRGHYHCIFCEFVGRQKDRVKIHIDKHISNVKKRLETAEYHVPDIFQDHSVPDKWILNENREEVRHWEKLFNEYVVDIYSKNAKTNNNVLSERKKSLIYNHVRLKMDIEDKTLKYWIKFRGIDVISSSQLDLHNVLVMPLTRYNNDEQNRAVNVQPEPLLEGSNIILRSDNPSEEFFQSYRILPTREQLFKLLYQIHILNGNHPSPKVMFGDIRRKYLYFPRALVDKFVAMCPTCCVHYSEGCNGKSSIGVTNGDLVNLAGLQVTVIDMTEHPDGKYHYVVECFDRCSRLTWLFPAERAIPTDLAESVIRSVLCITGLPCYIITNCGEEFLEKMLGEIDRRWNGCCSDLVEKSREAFRTLSPSDSDELMEALRELVNLAPSSWASALPHLQFRLNHTRGQSAQEHSAFELVFGKQRSRPNWQRFLISSHNMLGMPSV